MNLIERMQSIDKRIIYTVLLVVLIVPMVRPLGVPLSISQHTRNVYNFIENLDSDDMVLLSLDYSPGGSPDVHPQTVALVDHLVTKGIRFVMVAFWDAGPMYGEQILREYEEEGKVYGVDFVNLGFISGGETAIRTFASDIMGTAQRDHRGNATATLPIMQGIRDARDFALTVCFSSGTPGVPEWVRQVQGPLGINFAAGNVTVQVPGTMPFVQSGQVMGMLSGLRGAAEYEILMDKPGAAVAMMDAQSLGHLVIIGFILLGNIAYFLQKRQQDS